MAVQRGRGLYSSILKFAKKIAKTTVERQLGEMALNEIPNL